MAQRKALIGLVKAKVSLVTAQKDQIHESLNAYVDRVTAVAKMALETDEEDLSTIKEANCNLERVYECLIGLEGQMDEDLLRNPPGELETITASPISPQPFSGLSSAMADSETKALNAVELSKLQQRLDVLEIALTKCHDEINQNYTQQTTQHKEMESWCYSMEEKMENIVTEKTEAEKQNSLRHESVEEKVSQLKTYSQKQEQRLQSLSDEFLKWQTSNTDTSKQHELRLESVEEFIGGLDERHSERLKELISEQLLQTNTKLTEMAEKHSEMEEVYCNRMDKIQEQLNEVQFDNEDRDKHFDDKIGNVEKQLKKMDTAVKKDSSRVGNLVKEVETLKSQYSKRQQSSKLHTLEEKTETLGHQFSKLQDQVDNFEQLRQTVADLTSKVTDFVDRGDLLDVMKMNQSLKNTLDEVALKVDAIERSEKAGVLYREKEENKRRELEDRICVVETFRKTDLRHYAKKVQDVNDLFKQVCQMVDEKVEPLRRLQRILNDFHRRVEKREDLSLRLDKVTEKVEEISSQVQTMERSQQKSAVGFTAYYPDMIQLPAEKSIITDFTRVLCNEGNCYNPSTGHFTASRDGFYLTSVTIRQCEKGSIDLHIVKHFRVHREPSIVCKSSTYRSGTSCCGVAVVKLNAGDTLSVKVFKATENVNLSPYSSFSCLAI